MRDGRFVVTQQCLPTWKRLVLHVGLPRSFCLAGVIRHAVMKVLVQECSTRKQHDGRGGRVWSTPSGRLNPWV